MALTVIRTVLRPGPGGLLHKASFHSSALRPLEYGVLAYFMGERTTPRLKQYSKIISVDGNLSSGKGALAQKLADRLGMLYMPEPDTFFLDREKGQQLPSRFNGMCSLEKFYQDPTAPDGNSFRVQSWMYGMRVIQYADALEHLITTGQGVVLERSPYSDMVFIDAMFKLGWIRRECVDHYNEVRSNGICELLPPHLSIYIDVPAEEVQKKLQQSAAPHLQNVPLAYLKAIEDSYKKTFLPKISETSEVLVYDGATAQDVEKVVEDIEYLKFEKGPWLEQDDTSFHHLRLLVEDKPFVKDLTWIPKHLPEITMSAQEYFALFHEYRSLPGNRYASGYNADVGDKLIWLK